MSDADAVERRLESLSPKQRRLIELRLARERAGGSRKSQSEPIPPQPRDGRPFPLSFAQQRLWFLDQLEPGSPWYNMAIPLRLTGRLDAAALAASLSEIERRHETLRTTFALAGEGSAVQTVGLPAGLPLCGVDLRRLPPAVRETEILRLLSAEVRRPFDLARGPLLRAVLYSTSEDEHAFLLCMHHIVSDGWSLGVLVKELAGLYEAFSQGRSPSLPTLPIQYVDFAVWQRGLLAGPALAALRAYWQRQLAGMPPLVELPTDRPRPAVQTFRGATLPLVLPPGTTAALQALSRREGATPFMTLLAAFLALLHRYTGQNDLAVGSPIANRERVELEGLIGFFVNTLVLRGDLSGDPGFRELLARVKLLAAGAYGHQDLPFEKLVEELEPERQLSHAPLFQVLFVLQNAPVPALNLSGLTLAPLPACSGTSKFDLSLYFWESEPELSGHFEYNTDLFDPATIARLADHFTRLVAGALAHPERRISELPLLGPTETHHLLAEAGDTAPAFHVDPGITRVQEPFEAQAARTPDAVALIADAVAGEERLTYCQLDRRANQLAHRLRALGVGPESLVGIAMRRSAGLVVAILATLKAGGAYVPLDPEYPAERIAFVLEDSRAPVLLADLEDVTGLLGKSLGSGVRRICPAADSEREAIATLPTEPPALSGPAGLAYVIYTSGSTGRPKGVGIEHRSALLFVHWAREVFPPEDLAGVLFSTSICFDLSVFELFVPLSWGGRIVLAEDALALPGLAAAAEVTLVNTVPSAIAELVRQGALPSSVRTVCLAGEPLSRAVADAIYAEPGVERLYDLYGPTEDTTYSTFARVERGSPREPTIGRPLPGTRVHLLDRRHQPVPLGVPGELCLAGDGLARGYLGRPELTAERFIPDSFSPEPGGRLYLTGDLARWLPNGNLAFHGRIDHQVKIRGFRIELGEIEAALHTHPAVREAVVMAGPGPSGEPRLVAYVVQGDDFEDGGEEVDAWRAEHMAQWRALYDHTYGGGDTAADTTFNIAGWHSSYTGDPIPSEEMRAWVDATIGRILSLAGERPRPPRILEIGCGTGLLLFRLAPHAASYEGWDFSAAAVAYLEAQLAERPLPGVSVARRTADDFTGIEPGSYDLVILNSVVQYFPDVEYLRRVLAGATQVVAPGGAVFVGDVRSLPLLGAFAASVELFQAPGSLPAGDLAQRVHRRLQGEEELALDPPLFTALAESLPGIAQAEMHLKRGRQRNELVRFRYDAVLRLHAEAAGSEETAEPARHANWAGRGLSIESVRRQLAGERPADLVLHGVPNARVLAAVEVAERLVEPGGLTASDLAATAREAEARGFEPEDFWSLGEELGYAVDVRWTDSGADGSYEVWLHRPDAVREAVSARPAERTRSVHRPWGSYANNPLQGQFARRLVPHLRAFLGERLPDHMVPSVFALLDALPLTPNGKINRKALVPPDTSRPRVGAAYVAPRIPTEETLAAIWSDVLDVDRIGMHDNFFELGGHSLLATQLVSRLQRTFGIELPLRLIFEAPTVTGLAQSVELALREGRPAPPPIFSASRQERLPLSFAQQRLWLIDQLEPGSAAYNIPAAVRLEGNLDPAALEMALSDIVRRHEVLRTTFDRGPEGEPVQQIRSSRAVPLPVIDLRGLATSAAESIRLAREEAGMPFHLAAGPVLRASLILTEEREQVLLLTMHHIVSDGWSIGVLVRELVALYRAFISQEASPLPELPVQYADFAVWQRRWLTGEVLASELSYWREHLAGARPTLELPTDRPRPAVRTLRGATLPVDFPAALLEDLRQLAHRRGTTLFMVLLAGFQTLLARLAGQRDVSVGTPIAGRTHLQTEGLIGFFVNTLVLRSDLSDEPGFGELLERVRETTLEAYAHQDLPFEKLVEELAPERDLGRTPLFQVMLALQNAPVESLELPGLRLEPFNVGGDTAKFELTLSLAEVHGVLTGTAEYRKDLFDATTIRRLLGQLENLLGSALSAPEGTVFDLELMGAAERLQVVKEWSGVDLGYPRERCVHELFEEQVDLHPDTLAVSLQEEAWSYGELDRRSGLLAERLRRLGVGPEVLVGLFTERSLEMVAGLLGILKAGGAYVPLDPSYPAERLEWMLRDSGAPVVLVQERLSGNLPAGPWRAVELDASCHGSGLATVSDRSARPSPDNLAYLLYTSGSTGKPKGVAVPHRAVVRLVRGRDDLCIGTDEVWLQLAPLAFDASTLEIWGPLANGGRLEVFGPDKPTIEELGRTAEAASVSSLWLTAGLFHQVAESDLRSLRGLRKLLAGGDVLSPAHVQRTLEQLPACRVINGYGPTENTTFTSCHALTAPSQVDGPVPIGRPIANTRVYLVRHFQPVPPGVPGELLTGGDGLARGYHGRQDLTAEFFVPDPFAEQPGERLYRTGDLARWRPDGAIDFLGRIDQQVKIRGFRVEPGEIEAALVHHAGLSEALVLAVEDERGDRRLVVYGVASGDRHPGAEELRVFLLQSLPEHLVPSAFVILPALPLTANGKVDRRALAALRPERLAAAPGAGAAPRTPAEELLAAMFAEVLGLEQVRVEDDFFGLGGHSLMATRLVSRIREVFGRELPLRLVFESPTVAKLAERITLVREGQSAPPIQPVPRDPGLPLSFAQQRLWLIDQLDPGNPAYNIPLALRLTGAMEPGLLERIFSEIIRRHETLRTTFVSGESGPVQVIAAPEPLELPLLDLSHLPEDQREAQARALALSEARHPFDLQQGPLLRLLLVRLAETEHLLLLTLHHIVSDGWSQGVLLREVAALYEGAPLPALPVQYADFAVWQRSWLQREVLEAQLDHWKRQLAGAPAVLELPLDRPRPGVQVFRGAFRPAALGPALSDAVRRLCRERGVTPFMALLAAWAVLLGRHAGQEDVLLGSPIAGRNRREIEGLIGFFVNTLVLRSDLSGSPSFGELLERVRRTALDAFSHQDLPFERIVEEVVVERNLAVSPLFQVLFALQNAPLGELALPGLALAPVAVDAGLAKFDLSLVLQEGPAGFTGRLDYNTDLFDGTTAERVLEQLRVLLAGAVADPGRRLVELPLLTESGRHQVLVEWAAPRFAAAEGGLVQDLFRACAARNPGAVALVAGGSPLTYGELAARVGQLARRLIRRGVGPEVTVGICLDEPAEIVTAMLAVLEAGGAFLPLDPAYPAERKTFILQDAQAALLVDRLDEALDGPAGEIAALPCLPENLAYVIYTSGTTGQPKGVGITHQTLVPMLSWGIETFGLGEHTRVLQNLAPWFDFGVFEILTTLLAGGTLYIPDERKDASRHGAFLREHRINTLHSTPSFFREVLATGETLPDLEVLHLGGEALFQGAVQRMFDVVGEPCHLYNGYGPTEATINCALFDAGTPGERRDRGAAAIPIGRATGRHTLYVRDRNAELTYLAGIGVPGELCVGGEGLARGYLNRPELTAQSFQPDPFSATPGARLYRTGDLVRFLPAGEIEFLGRIDQQVKLRGLRIELGEIETVLAVHPGVREVVALVREDRPGDQRLVAYVVSAAEGGPSTEDLRQLASARLPAPLVPSAIVFLDALSRTATGKVDRKALPAPQAIRVAEGGYDAPSDPVEELLAGIWSEVLGIERVGIHDNFFALGGHSLLATQVTSCIRGLLGMELPLRQLFEAPTIADLARALREAGSAVQAPPILPVPRGRDLPLSFAQQRLWLVDQIEPGSPAYNMPLAVRLTGGIDPRLLERIFSEILRRHEALRTTFPARDNGPVQVIAPPQPVELTVLDLSGLPETGRETQARDLALFEAQRPFDLQRGPLLRLLLARLSETDHLLLLTLHHIVSDGWSMGVLLREIAALHEAFSQHRPSPLADLPVQYADFAAWQRNWLQGEVLDAQLDGWKRQLDGAPAALDLPLDRPRPTVQSYRGARRPVVLSSPLSQAIGRLCRQQGLTPFMALLAAWAVLLGRHAGQDDVLVGVPIAGRNRREVEGLIGFFVNTLVLRTELSGTPTLAELLGRVRRTALDAFTNQDLPFERLVEGLAPERSLARAPLFQVMLVLQNAPSGDLTIPGLTVSQVDVDAGYAKFDLSMTLSESLEGFAGALTYATDLFDPSTAERLIAGFQTLLAGMAEADPGGPLHGLEVLPEAERRQLLVEWSTEETRTSDLSIYQLFERQAERTPDTVAVIYEEERWTYRDLLRRSREIAGFLREQGVGPEDRVAILDRRSAERVARVLGVFASGAAFVAIDREQPEARRAEILADVAPVWILPPRPPLPEGRGGEAGVGGALLLPEVDAPASTRLSSRGPEGCPGSAYVVYTSGSTGRPKGILAHHRGAAIYLEWVIRNYGFSESDVALQLAPLTFDASLRDTLAPLASGGGIVIVPEDVARDPAALLERMEAHGVTCLPSIVPSLLRLLLDEAMASGRKVPSLRLILASGEKLHGADGAAVRRTFGERVSLVNQYGASEATMSSTWHAVTAADEARPALPVGRPAASARVFLLDSSLRPVPLGAVGEICFGGPGLTFGYLGQPDRTAEAFVPDPFGAPGERLYRTGDRGRYRPDGVLELLGRIDFQVKIRGQRVEPGEVEAVLRSHPAVRQAVVADRGEDEPRLAAWLVAEGVGADDLRAFLAERLPAPMIPAAWSFLDALPLTPHGKVDRSRLPEPSRERAAVQEPRDRTELRLVRLWEEVLGIQPVGISDNFFTLGGHSLSAVRLMAGIRRLFGRDLPLSEVFRRPTLEMLADILRCSDRDRPWSPLVALTAGRAGEVPLFCIHGGEGHALTFADLARTLSAAGEDWPVFALEARGLSDGQTPLERIEEMAGLYLDAIREAWPRGPYRLLGYSMGSKIAFEIALRLERDGETVEQLVLLDIPALPRADAILDPEIPAEMRALPGFDPELADRYLAVFRANLKASHSWTPVPIRGRVLLLVAEEGICAGAVDPTLGWGAVAEGGVRVVSVPGDHFSLLRSPHVQTLAGSLTPPTRSA